MDTAPTSPLPSAVINSNVVYKPDDVSGSIISGQLVQNQQQKKCIHHRLSHCGRTALQQQQQLQLQKQLQQQQLQQQLQLQIQQQQPQQSLLSQHNTIHQPCVAASRFLGVNNGGQHVVPNANTAGVTGQQLTTVAAAAGQLQSGVALPLPATAATSPPLMGPVPIQGQTGLVQQLSAALLAERYLLMDLVDGSTLYKCIDVKTHEELVCKVRDSLRSQ